MTTRTVTVVALAVWIVLGQLGGFVPAGPTQNLVWAFSSAGLVVASPLLALRSFRDGRDLSAAGHLVLTAAAMVMYAGGPISTPEGQASFSMALFFYPVALLLISAERAHPMFSRVLGGVAALPFALFGALALARVDLPESTRQALMAAGYLPMTAAVAGWIVGLVRPALPHTAPTASGRVAA